MIVDVIVVVCCLLRRRRSGRRRRMPLLLMDASQAPFSLRCIKYAFPKFGLRWGNRVMTYAFRVCRRVVIVFTVDVVVVGPGWMSPACHTQSQLEADLGNQRSHFSRM